MQNYLQTVISQFGNSPTILAMIDTFNQAVDPSADIDNFVTWVWQVSTAQGFGLDIWGRIVGVSRTIPGTPATVLADSDYRQLILLKALSNISIATSPSINGVLIDWIGSTGVAYVCDLGNMEILYQFQFALTQTQLDILTLTGIFLRPAGVGGWLVSTVYPVFGFNEMGTTWAAPFDQQPFLPSGYPASVA